MRPVLLSQPDFFPSAMPPPVAPVGRSVGNTADDVLVFLETLTISEGRHTGAPFKVLPWQKKFIKGAFKPSILKAALSVARGNGKTTLVAGIACAALIGPLAKPRGKTIIVASSFAQGRIAFDHILYFMRPFIQANPKAFRIQDSSNMAAIEHLPTGALVRCIGSDPKKAHGLAPSLALLDEPSMWERSQRDKMFSAIQTSQGKLEDARMIALGTQPNDQTHWFAKMLAGAECYAQNHAAKPDADLFLKKTWKSANPSLPHMPDLLLALKSEAKTAKHDPVMLASFKAYRLNMGTSEEGRPELLSVETWARIEGEAEMSGPCYWGVDLGANAAMSAIAAYWPETGALDCLACFPNIPSLEERALGDNVEPHFYQSMLDRDELILCGNRISDPWELILAAIDRFGEPVSLTADCWRKNELFEAMTAAGLTCYLELRRQGFRDGAEDVRAFRSACLKDNVTPTPRLILRAAMAEATVVADAAGNEKLSKSTEGGRRWNARDDAVAAAILAVSAGTRLVAKPRSYTFENF